MSKKKKNEYPQFYTSRLIKNWPFSLKLAEDLFCLNQLGVYLSLRDFFVYTDTTFALEEEGESDSLEYRTDLSYSERNEIIGEMGVWYISRYPGFCIKNNKVHYEETLKSKVQNSRKEELIIKIYTLDHISYQTIILEGTKFYINNFFQGYFVIFKFDTVCLNILSLEFIWLPVFNYLLFTKLSSSMKKMLENQNYKKNYEEQILITFKGQFKKIKRSSICLNKILTKRSVFEERLLNVLLFSSIPENKSKTLITNFFLTESLDEILSFYQELVSQFKLK